MSYSKSLKEFIDYVFETYQGDECVSGFKAVYEERQRVLTERKAKREDVKKEQKAVAISQPTASVCNELITAEIERAKIVKGFSKNFLTRLKKAKSELDGLDFSEQNRSGFKKLLERLRNGFRRNVD